MDETVVESSIRTSCIIAQCVLCLYPLYSSLAWPARATYLFCPCLYSCCGCTIAQCVLYLYLLYSVLAWPARVMYLSYPCLCAYCACTVAQCVLCLYLSYSGLAWPARAMYLLTRVYPRTVLVPVVQWFGMVSKAIQLTSRPG